jgi:hypothetical protein
MVEKGSGGRERPAQSSNSRSLTILGWNFQKFGGHFPIGNRHFQLVGHLVQTKRPILPIIILYIHNKFLIFPFHGIIVQFKGGLSVFGLQLFQVKHRSVHLGRLFLELMRVFERKTCV